jgi:hypothetical protein
MSATAIQRALVLACFLAVVAAGIPRLGKATSGLPLVDHGRNSSVNTVLEQTLGEPGMPDAIRAWLAKLPPGRPILVVAAPNNMPADITADSVSYLAWPRPVVVGSKPEEIRALMSGARERFAAVGFCYLSAPPGITQGKLFGPALRFLPSQPVPE